MFKQSRGFFRRLCLVSILFINVLFVKGQNDSIYSDNVPGVLQKMVGLADWGVDLLTFEKGNCTLFIMPLVGYEERTQLEYGVMPVLQIYSKANSSLNSKFKRPSSIAPSILFSTTGMYELDLSSNIYIKDKWNIKGKWLYQWMPDKFYQIGNLTDKNNYSDIEVSKFEFTGQILKNIGTKWFVGLSYDFANYEVDQVSGTLLDVFSPKTVKGNIGGIGGTIIYDSRDNISYPSEGSYAEVQNLHYLNVFGYSSFGKMSFDFRKFYRFLNSKRILALQLKMQHAWGDVPFYRLSFLGGKRLFRSVAQPYKYMDKSSVYMQVAYRSHIWWRLGGELFSGVGNVFSQWNDDVFKKVHGLLGAGLRVKVLENDGLNLRFDYGVSNYGNSAFYFTLGEAF